MNASSHGILLIRLQNIIDWLPGKEEHLIHMAKLKGHWV